MDIETLKLECLKLAVQQSMMGNLAPAEVVAKAQAFSDYVMNVQPEDKQPVEEKAA